MPKQSVALDIDKLKTVAQDASRLIKVLANPDRLILLCQLTQGEKCVSELEQASGIHQPSLSQQLTVLRHEEVVATRRDGKHVYYQLASPQAIAVMRVLYDQFCRK